MDDRNILDEICYWNSEIASIGNANKKIYELALFKIFVKFEVFLTELFIKYSIGKESKNGYIPERKLCFLDEKHLECVLKNSKNSFIDYIEKIQNLSEHIFISNRNPFSLVFEDARLSVYYNQMKYIRNYIAHESKESKHKYHKHVLGEATNFIEPYEYLAKINKKKGITNYSIYINIILEMVEILLNPLPYWGINDNNIVVPYAAITKEDE